MIARLDRLLEPYGGLGAIPRALQISHWMLDNELAQLQTLRHHPAADFPGGRGVHPERRAQRALALQREQIAALKALGYGNGEARLALHEVGLAHRAAGVVSESRPARGSGSGMVDLYNEFFRFPVLPYQRARCTSCSVAAALTLGRGRVGALRRRAPGGAAAAGRSDAPEPPARYRATLFETPAVARALGAAGRMVLRNIVAPSGPAGARRSSASPSPWRS